jgi:hypothetical protein
MITRETVAKVEEEYQQGNQVNGVTFVRHKDKINGEIHYATDNDNALYTGLYLAAASYRYAVEPSQENVMAVLKALSGIRLLTTVTGTPGVLVRWVFPLEDSYARIGYDSEKSLEHVGNSYGDLIRSGQLNERSGYAFYTKTTRDQIGGVLFGLTAAYELVEAARPLVKKTIGELHARFLETNWSLEDHEGKTGTSAHKLDAPNKLVVKALYRRAHGSGDKPKAWFFRFIWLVTIHYNRWITNTYSFGLNLFDAHSLMLLNKDHKEAKGARTWHNRLWRFVRKDKNPHFEALHLAATGEPISTEAMANLERRGEEPYRKFFSWSRPPKDWWSDGNDVRRGPGIDVLLPYWMNEFYRDDL